LPLAVYKALNIKGKTMIETKPKIEYSILEEKDAMPVIIVAAGNSTRMGSNKQLMTVRNIPVIVRTLMAFQGCESVSRIILVTRAEDIFVMQSLADEYGISKLSDIVCGGKNRPESVLNGFARLSQNEETVLIHDGARPLVTSRVICSVADALKERVAVTCAVKVKDTIKQVDENGKVVKTLLRDSLVAVQTPQGVKTKEYLDAINKAEDISVFTDDMSVMESAGYDVYTVEGDYKNIKITTYEDILSAEGFLEEEE